MADPFAADPGELFLAVERPSRYTGGEVNAVRKAPERCRLHVALAFPDTYEVGMSHLGLQILYAVLNGIPQVACERCYAPWPDMEGELRRRNRPLCSLESQRPLHAFDIVGFSLQYELSYTNVLMMLELGGIPLRREARGEEHPVIIAGGPSAFNPAPMSAFIDAFAIGEGEEVVGEIAEAVMAVRMRGGKRREQIEALAALRGVYVPALHTGPERIGKRIIADMDLWREPLCPVVPLMKTIHDRVTLEIARGCTRGCRFCQAGMVWRPVRERTPAVLEEMAEAMLKATGHDELSLLSLSSGDHSRIEPLLTTLMDRYYARRVALALPSLRSETLTPTLIEGIRRVRKTSFTLAPEAGTQRLRDVINKGNTEEELLTTTERVFAAGWKAVKLYFMIGLPGEQEEDREGIAELAHRVLRTAKNRGQVTVSLSTFVPKPHTPFQWQRQIGVGEILDRQAFFKGRLKNRNIGVKWHDARMSLLEGIFSRGGAETGELVETAFRLGCRFDGWSDRFRFDLWEEALRRTGIDAEASLRERDHDEPLPWERIDCGVRREFLIAEAEKAGRGEATPDCRTGACGDCGVCDGTIRVVTAPADAPVGTIVSSFGRREGGTGGERAFRLRFTKLGPARFLSHLELSSALHRAMLLGGIFFVYSQGFHPHPRISFAGATAVGMESRCEFADIRIEDPGAEPETLMVRINAGLPAGMAVTAMQELTPHPPSLAELVAGFVYELWIPPGITDAEMEQIDADIARFLKAESFPVRREAGGKTAVKEIRPLVASLALDKSSRRIILSVHCGPQGTVRPGELLTALFGFSPESARSFRTIKTTTLSADFAGPADRAIFIGDKNPAPATAP
ncbi:MAG: TIGR03960 family B12-binding radical SAM protein [Deltaproteobacteria bacterium]|nr:TIGR03960 family B12-binding radical SAM protein [Deltaproteobacteria bacterium]